ncbi:hypothetical protein BpHYR1_022023 [Brachionus plicatilis]|uniref:Uncharacterized protein n=1 Tax=Brachionus plicatilis TaxID=10195 RepID=A0A3M7PMG8_BRAPC|nr:hypothetical protein BpHYR1_022023 [Brachionus plicatilis]
MFAKTKYILKKINRRPLFLSYALTVLTKKRIFRFDVRTEFKQKIRHIIRYLHMTLMDHKILKAKKSAFDLPYLNMEIRAQLCQS